MRSKAEDVIFNSVYKPALALGYNERNCKDCAVQAIQDYKKGRFKDVKTLVAKAIKKAK